MSNISTCLEVKAFFEQYNWDGIQLTKESKVEKVSWECLTVTEFFQKHNWEGKAVKINQGEIRRSLSFTLSVKEFLGLIVWKGNSQKLSQLEEKVITAKEQINSGQSSLKVTDLSDLF